MQNDKIVSLSEYLKAEKREARDDWKARLGFEEEVRNEYVEYSNLVSLATSRSELEEVSKKVRARIRVLEVLEVDKPFYLGEVPEGYLTPSWSNIAKTWKPKYIVIKKDIKFKLKTLPEGKPKPQTTADSIRVKKAGRKKEERKQFEEYLTCEENQKGTIKNILASEFRKNRIEGILVTIIALTEKGYINRATTGMAAMWDSTRLLLNYKENPRICSNTNFNKQLGKLEASIAEGKHKQNAVTKDKATYAYYQKVLNALSLV